MILEKVNGLTVLYSESNNKITNKERTFFNNFIYLGKNDSIDNYEEVGRDIWKNFVKEENPDIIELQAQTKDINDNLDVVMNAIVSIDEQNNAAIDVILLAIDELYTIVDSALLISKGGE